MAKSTTGEPIASHIKGKDPKLCQATKGCQNPKAPHSIKMCQYHLNKSKQHMKNSHAVKALGITRRPGRPSAGSTQTTEYILANAPDQQQLTFDFDIEAAEEG